MEAVRTSETSVYFNETTWRYIPEGCYLRWLHCSQEIATGRHPEPDEVFLALIT
jgi:hypothetical protein